MRRELCRQACVDHGVPVIVDVGCVRRTEMRIQKSRACGGSIRDEWLATPGPRTTLSEQARRRFARCAQRPLERHKPAEGRLTQAGDTRDVEGAASVVSEARQACMLLEDVRSGVEGKGLAIAEPECHLAQDPPVGPGVARQCQKRALARDAPLGVGDGTVLLAPRRSRKADVRVLQCVVAGDVLETTSSSSLTSASHTASARGKDTAGLVPMTHIALIRPSAAASNMPTAFNPSPLTTLGASQKRRTRSRSGFVKPMWAASMLRRGRRPRGHPWRWAAR